jgi:aminoglycoside phosphotransferase (APT) family kinase protein
MSEEDDRLDRLARSLGRPVRPWRAGTDFWADLVDTDDGLAVVRSPRIERAETSYDGVVDFGAVIEKEVEALELMSGAGIPVPKVLGRRLDPSWILLSYVPHDEGAAVPLDRLGELTRKLHGIRPSAGALRPPSSWTGFVRNRLRQRLHAARRYCDLPGDDALLGPVTALLETREAHATSLLHMDLRPANVCVAGGEIAALIDVANCIVGDPLMELGRVRGYGLLTEEFRAGYGGPAESTLLDVYELDTALLLTVVSVEEFDDPALHREQSARARELARSVLGNRGLGKRGLEEPGHHAR